MTTGNPWSAIASGIGSGATLVLKICEYTYALRAVDQQTEEYLIVAQHAWENIGVCQRLLRHRTYLLPASERQDYERVIRETEKAARAVALLLEPARVDTDADSKIRFSTRLSWVLADNANIDAALKRLGIVHSTLTQNIATLRLLRPGDMTILEATRSNERLPSYQSCELLHWKHQTRLTPKPSMQSVSGVLVSQPGTPTFAQSPQGLGDELRNQFKDNGSSAPTIPTSEIHAPVELSAGPVPLSGSSSRPELSEKRSISGSEQNGSVSSSMSWLERQAMKSNVMRQNQRMAQNV